VHEARYLIPSRGSELGALGEVVSTARGVSGLLSDFIIPVQDPPRENED
jgi:hypothetical protein